MIVTNVFALRSTDPGKLKAVEDPVGPGNDAAILRAAKAAAIVVCAWGNHGAFLDRSSQVKNLLRKMELHSLRLNANGEPAHPLYLPGGLRPRRWAC